MTDSDVLVVGGGLGGVAAALTAAAEGASVTVISPRNRPFNTHAGVIDVLGYPSTEDGPVARPFDELGSLPADHPYSLVGETALRDGLATFDEATGDAYTGGDANGLVPTAVGDVRPALRYPQAVEAGLCGRSDSMTVVGVARIGDVDQYHVVDRLQTRDVPFDVDAIGITVPTDDTGDAPALRLARALDETAPASEKRGLRDSVARSIKRQLADPDRVGLPAVLGLSEAPAVRADLEASLETDVFEIPLGSPSVVGRRLGATFRGALDEAGVERMAGTDVAGVERERGRIANVSLESGGVISPAVVVLAPGGLEAGGIVAHRSGVREPRFGCHVPHPADRDDWTELSALGDHRLATFGVRIDETCRPRTADGDPVAANLFAAGRVIGGHDLVAQHAVAGVALATGAASGQAAVDQP